NGVALPRRRSAGRQKPGCQLQLHAAEVQPGSAAESAHRQQHRGSLGGHAMSLLKRLEHGGAVAGAPAVMVPGDATHNNSSAATPEPTFRPNPVQNQLNEAQRSLKDRVKRQLISE